MRMAIAFRFQPLSRSRKTKSGAMKKRRSAGITGWKCDARGNSPALRATFSVFVHVLDIGLIEQQVGPLGPVHLEARLVVPFDHAMQGFSIAQHEYHGGLGLHLFYVVEILSVGLVRGSGLLLSPSGWRDLLLYLGQRRTNEFSIS